MGADLVSLILWRLSLDRNRDNVDPELGDTTNLHNVHMNP